MGVPSECERCHHQAKGRAAIEFGNHPLRQATGAIKLTAMSDGDLRQSDARSAEFDDDQAVRRPPIWYRRRVLYAVMVTFAVAVGLWLSWQVRWSLCLAFLAVLIAIFFDSGAKLVGAALGKFDVDLSRGKRLAIFCILLLIAAGLFGWFASQAFISQVDELREQLPGSLDAAEEAISQYAPGRWLVESTGGLQSASGQLKAFAKTAAMSTMNFFIAIVFVFITGLYLTIEPGVYRRGLLWLMPPRWRFQTRDLLDDASDRLHHFLVGQFSAMLIVGTLSGLGLWILGVPMPLVNGVITTFACFIPNIGPIISVVPPLLLSFGVTDGWLLSGPQLAVAVMVLYLAIQLIESYVITPLIQKRAIDMPPAILITSQLLMGYLIGIVGVAITAPLVVLVMVMVRQLWTDGDLDNDDPMDNAVCPEDLPTNDPGASSGPRDGPNESE